MHYNVYQLLMLFLIYSFLGWCVEVSFVAVTTGRVVNRGFLNGPVCPIYGVGMLGALLLLEPVSGNLVLLFFLGMLLCTLVELIGGWILEKAFHTRWWDYTDKPFNLGGYICLGFSIMWGFAVTFAVRLIHPLIFSLVCWLPHLLGWISIGVLYALFLIDFVLTLITVVGIRKQLGELERVGQALHTVGDTISDRLGNSALAADAKLESAKIAGQERMAESKEKPRRAPIPPNPPPISAKSLVPVRPRRTPALRPPAPESARPDARPTGEAAHSPGILPLPFSQFSFRSSCCPCSHLPNLYYCQYTDDSRFRQDTKASMQDSL